MIHEQTGKRNFLPDYDNVSRMPSTQYDFKDLTIKISILGAKPIRNKVFRFPLVLVIMKLFTSTPVSATKQKLLEQIDHSVHCHTLSFIGLLLFFNSAVTMIDYNR